MEKKNIQIDHNILDSTMLGFVFSLLTVFVLEHFSTYSYVPNLGKQIISYGGQVITPDSFDTSITPIGALYQTTPFGTKISLPTNGMMCSELLFKDTDFKRYSNQAVLYFKAVFSDYKYLLLFWITYMLIVLFFKRYRLKVLILVLPITIISCDNKIVHENASTTAIQTDTAIQTANSTTNLPQFKTAQIKCSFVVFKVRDKFFEHKESIIVTSIFETPLFITKDEEYLILDNVQEQCKLNLFDKNIIERFMMRLIVMRKQVGKKKRY
ncbi:hypothetical protein GCM10023210_39220 [Chryseobacterium ginsengisoli]|uniref:Uncharacterized protein n=1 Tax=Chryseobacterium ginsengisoli TaxID=363853 RepID=A0ABP9MRF7_9FLAO